jgi:hypothetical protein
MKKMLAIPAPLFWVLLLTAAMAFSNEMVQHIYTTNKLQVQAKYIVRRLNLLTSMAMVKAQTRDQHELPTLIFCLKTDDL